MDVVFVIDTSGSMSGDNAKKMVNAVNSSIRTIMSKNSNTRIGVVGFNDSASTIIPLGNYEQNKDYLKLDSNKIKSLVTINSSKNVSGGTNTQAGIKLGAEMLTSVEETTFTQEINGVSYTGTRTPVLILATDGDPTYYYDDEKAEGTRHGSGGSYNENYYYWTIRTAKYYKDQVTAHYYSGTTNTAKMFTIGIDLDTNAAKAMLNPNQANIDPCNDGTKIETKYNDFWGFEYQEDNRSMQKKLYDLLNTIEEGETEPNPYRYSYADGSTTGTLTEDAIENFLNSSLSASTESIDIRKITIEQSQARKVVLENIDTSKEFSLKIIISEDEPLEYNSLESATTAGYVKQDDNHNYYVDLTGIATTTEVNIVYWQQSSQT